MNYLGRSIYSIQASDTNLPGTIFLYMTHWNSNAGSLMIHHTFSAKCVNCKIYLPFCSFNIQWHSKVFQFHLFITTEMYLKLFVSKGVTQFVSFVTQFVCINSYARLHLYASQWNITFTTVFIFLILSF